MKTALLDPINAQHSGKRISAVLDNAFFGFALNLPVFSTLLDRFGAKKMLQFAAACFTAGPVPLLLAGNSKLSVVMVLNLAIVIWGYGWRTIEASISPFITTLYADDMASKLHALNIWSPA